MRALASLVCGFIFGWGLFISGMIRPDKVLGFLDVLAIPSGNWDPSLAVVMAAALAVTGIGYALARPRTPVFEAKTNGRHKTRSIGRWSPARCCSGSAGAWSDCVRDRRSKTSATLSPPRDRFRRRHGGRHGRVSISGRRAPRHRPSARWRPQPPRTASAR